jgi:hypothetical protein
MLLFATFGRVERDLDFWSRNHSQEANRLTCTQFGLWELQREHSLHMTRAGLTFHHVGIFVGFLAGPGPSLPCSRARPFLYAGPLCPWH